MMKTAFKERRTNPWCPCGGVRVQGFTMVEIALSLAIIAFALVAIIGVLPTGMKVQQENQQETVIDQDGRFLLEAIRSGSIGIDDLMNHVEMITIQSGPVGRPPSLTTTYTNGPASGSSTFQLASAEQIVGLLSTPKFETLSDGTVRQNVVEAQINAISGVPDFKTADSEDFAFRYRVRVEITPVALLTNRPAELPPISLEEAKAMQNLQPNLHEVRLLMGWPLYPRGGQWQVGRYRKLLRTQVAGDLQLHRRSYGRVVQDVYFFDRNTFTSVD